MEKYFVVFHKREWIVKHGPGGFDAYPDRDAAIAAAVDQAHRSGDARTSVVVQADDDWLFRTEGDLRPDPAIALPN